MILNAKLCLETNSEFSPEMISFKPLKLAYIRDHFNQEIELSIISEIVLELNYPYGIIRKSDKKQNCEMRAKFYKE